MFIAKVKTVSLTAAACLVVAGTGVVVAKQVTGTAMPVAAPVVNQPTPIQMAQNNPPATAPVTPPAGAGTETKPPTVQPKVEPGVQKVKAPIGNPANDPNVRPLVRVEDPASGMVVRALDSINSFSIAAYAKDGKMIWQVKLPRRAEGLTIANGKVFVQPDGSAYDLQTGTAQGKLR